MLCIDSFPDLCFRLGSGKPQNLIIDDDGDDEEDDTFVVEDSAPAPVEPTQVSLSVLCLNEFINRFQYLIHR